MRREEALRRVGQKRLELLLRHLLRMPSDAMLRHALLRWETDRGRSASGVERSETGGDAHIDAGVEIGEHSTARQTAVQEVAVTAHEVADCTKAEIVTAAIVIAAFDDRLNGSFLSRAPEQRNFRVLFLAINLDDHLAELVLKPNAFIGPDRRLEFLPAHRVPQPENGFLT